MTGRETATHVRQALPLEEATDSAPAQTLTCHKTVSSAACQLAHPRLARPAIPGARLTISTPCSVGRAAKPAAAKIH